MKKVPLENGDSIWVFETEIDGTTIVAFVAENEKDAKALLNSFSAQLPLIWPTLYSTMESGFDDYERADEFPPEEFFLSLGRVVAGEDTKDGTRFHVRFEFEIEESSDELPSYEFFLDENFGIVHHRPVFEEE